MNRDFMSIGVLRSAYLAKYAADVSQLCAEQVENEYQRRGLVIPVYASSTLHYLGEKGPVSVADISNDLQTAHQVTTQRVKKLEELRLIRRARDRDDARRVLLHLTAKGRDQFEKLKACMAAAACAYEDLFEDIGIDLADALCRAARALRRRSLDERLLELSGVEPIDADAA